VLNELESHFQNLAYKIKGIQAPIQQPRNLGKMKLFDIIYQDVDKDVSAPQIAITTFCQNGPRISHLMFADDILEFRKETQ
jgi:hypothetical protein